MTAYTPTQRRILAVLADGKPHSRRALLACLRDEAAEFNALQAHISNLRRALKEKGEDIVCQLTGWRICYRHVKLINSPSK